MEMFKLATRHGFIYCHYAVENFAQGIFKLNRGALEWEMCGVL